MAASTCPLTGPALKIKYVGKCIYMIMLTLELYTVANSEVGVGVKRVSPLFQHRYNYLYLTLKIY